MFGELIPLGGGDPIPLLKKILKVGRRESCDIVLRFSNVSAHHCELTIDSGYWYVKDLNSSNGIKVNDVRVTERRLDPGAKLSVAKHHYQVEYDPVELGAVGPPPPETIPVDIMSKSLLERAGLESENSNSGRGGPKRYDVMSNKSGQIKDPNRPT